MTSEPEPTPATVTAHLELTILGQPVRGQIEMPTTPVRLMDMLPVLQSLADVVVDLAARKSEEEGHPVSCKKGCGACCRQLVPIAEVEARRIRDLVNDLPEPRRSLIRARFVEARRRLEETGMLEKLLRRDEWNDNYRSIALAYFGLKIACPFLEEESCSIYSDRPVVCREYLVVSPPEHCARPTPETVKGVAMPARLWTILARFDEVPAGQGTLRWVPLSLAPEWADAHPEEPSPRPAPEFFRAIIERLTGSAISSPASTMLPPKGLDAAPPDSSPD